MLYLLGLTYCVSVIKVNADRCLFWVGVTVNVILLLESEVRFWYTFAPTI